MKLHQLIFGLHFIFATICHILLPLMFIGVINLLFHSKLNFFIDCLILGSTVFSLQFIINHLNNPNSFCILTHLENYFRAREGLPQYEDFLPRYYSSMHNIIKILLRTK